MFVRTPVAPLRHRRRHAQRLLALPIAIVMATGVVAASAISLRNGSAPRVATDPVATVAGSPESGEAAVASSSPQATPAPPATNPTTHGTRSPRVIHRGSAARKVVALTFDDGWSATNGRTIVSILLKEHVKATFFVNSIYLARDPDLWQSIAAAGFVVGNHTYLHHDATKMTTAQLAFDLHRNARVWQAVTGTSMAPLFRPPYGYRNAATDLAAAKAGFPDVILWDVDPKDTTKQFTDAQMIHNASMGRAGSIVLMHIGPDVTPRILARVIASYRARGFTFVTVPGLLSPPPSRPTPPPPAPAATETGPRLPGLPR